MVPDPPHDVATAHRRTKNKRKMNDLTVVETPANGDRLKAMVFDSVSSPIMKRVYNMALEEFLAWFRQVHIQQLDERW